MTESVDTVCTLDCPDACSLRITVEADRIVDIDASPANELTDGWICAKVKRHADRVYAPERVLTPLVRVGAKGAAEFRSASWDEAVELIADAMRTAIDRHGPAAVVPFTYNSSAATRERASFTEAFFAAIGATQVAHTICAATHTAAWHSVYGRMPSADPADVVHSDLIVIWGANPTVSNSHFAPLVQQTQSRGARVVVIDPRRTPLASRADLHLAVRPGTDVVLALAIAHWWREHSVLADDFLADHATGLDALLDAARGWSLADAASVCGIESEGIEQLARWWSATPRTMLRLGWGAERNANGGGACRAILSLPVLAGTFGEPGAGVIGAVSVGPDPSRAWPAIERRARRSLPMHQIGRWLAPDGHDPCRVLFVQGANPAVMCPDQRAVHRALRREDVFTVVHEQVITDTARFADVVLPATTSFEIDDVHASYGSRHVHPVRAAIDRVGESRSNDEVGLALAQTFGFDWSRQRIDIEPHLEELGPQVVTARLVDERLGAPAYQPIEAPSPTSLRLISPATSKLINSMFGEFQPPFGGITVHPDDAAQRRIEAGTMVQVSNAQGTITAPLATSPLVRQGVAVMAKGVWLRDMVDGGVNVLTPTSRDALADGACFNDTWVEVAPIAG
jgi:anaerobic selenocysteine-containing dehydrogenase